MPEEKRKEIKNSTAYPLITSAEKEDKPFLMEEYKVLLESINKINEVRETANNFWIAINGSLIAILAYIRDAESMGGEQKPFFLFTVLVFGVVLTLSWLSSLTSVKKNLEIRNEMAMEFEKYFPARSFTYLIKKEGKKGNWSLMVLQEMFVPLAFLIGYVFFAILLCISPKTLVPC